MVLKRSLMWNLKPSGKVMNFEVESRNGIILVWMIDLRFVRWNNIISSFWKLLSYLYRHCKEPLGDIFCKVNVIGLWSTYGTPSYDSLM